MAKLLQSFRYITIIGVIALLIASLDAFAWGCVKALEAIMLVVTSGGKDPEIAISLLEVVDSVLIATALFVFAANLYELFIAEIDLPDWMVAHNLHDLKAKLSSVSSWSWLLNLLNIWWSGKIPLARCTLGLQLPLSLPS